MLWAASFAIACLFVGSARVEGLGSLGPTEPDKAKEECINYLKAHRPARDLNLSDDFLLRNVELALYARAESTWAQQVPWELFLNDVLPYARYST
jgi:hypothetical protein